MKGKAKVRRRTKRKAIGRVIWPDVHNTRHSHTKALAFAVGEREGVRPKRLGTQRPTKNQKGKE